VKINSLTVCLADARRLLAAIEKLGLTPPKTLTDVPLAYERLTATTSLSPTPSNNWWRARWTAAPPPEGE
jgi:hypothetical protein